VTDAPTVSLVTGGSRGIGRAIAVELAARGDTVVVNFARNEGKAREVVEQIEGLGASAIAVQADVASEDHVRRLVREVKRAFGRLDVLVNNAGVIDDGMSMMMSVAKWRRVVDTNLTGTFLCCREGMKLMAYGGGGAVVNISSVSGTVGTEGQANYAASKGGVNSLTRTLAREGAHKGIRVNAVAPGLIETEMSQGLPQDRVDAVLRAVPLGRLGRAEEVARLVAFLASPDATYITGQTIAIDGGLS